MISQSNKSKVLTTLKSNGINYDALACDVTCQFLHWPWAEFFNSLGKIPFYKKYVDDWFRNSYTLKF